MVFKMKEVFGGKNSEETAYILLHDGEKVNVAYSGAKEGEHVVADVKGYVNFVLQNNPDFSKNKLRVSANAPQDVKTAFPKAVED